MSSHPLHTPSSPATGISLVCNQANCMSWDPWLPARLCGTSSGRSEHPVIKVIVSSHTLTLSFTIRILPWLLKNSRLDLRHNPTVLLQFPKVIDNFLSLPSRMPSLVALEKWRYNVRVCVGYLPARVGRVYQRSRCLTFLHYPLIQLDTTIPLRSWQLLDPILLPQFEVCWPHQDIICQV